MPPYRVYLTGAGVYTEREGETSNRRTVGPPNVFSLSCEPASHGDAQRGAPPARYHDGLRAARRRPEPLRQALQRRATIRRLDSSCEKFAGFRLRCSSG